MSVLRHKRVTNETDICASLRLNGSGKYNICCEIGFFKHLLESFAKHGLFDLVIKISGDIEVDQHHTVEDTGIVLGQLFAKSLNNKKGISRVGFCIFPMDEALSLVAIDICGRSYLSYDIKFKNRYIGGSRAM